MSKSKRAAQGSVTPAPRQERRIFTREAGGLRTGWLLAVSLVGYTLLALAARLALGRAFGLLFDAWGIDGESARRAPVWARTLYAWHGSLAASAVSAAVLGLSHRLRKLWGLGRGGTSANAKAAGLCACAGLCAAALIAALGLLPDSVRMAWPLSAPRLSPALIPLCALGMLSALAEECFGKRVLYDGVRARLGGGWATAVACAFFFLANGGYAGNAVSAVNVLLLGLLCCLVYARWGVWASAGLRWGWSFANAFLLGFGGGGHAAYRLYGVSEALLTGGDAGPIYGLWTTLALAVGIAALWRKRAKQRGRCDP